MIPSVQVLDPNVESRGDAICQRNVEIVWGIRTCGVVENPTRNAWGLDFGRRGAETLSQNLPDLIRIERLQLQLQLQIDDILPPLIWI
jgi:hypothetical protein